MWPDSVDQTISIILDRVRTQLDTIHLPRIQVQHLDSDSVSTLIIVDGDTIRTPNVMRLRGLHGDSAWGVGLFGRDSTWVRIFPDSVRHFGIFSDSIHGFSIFRGDSAWARPFDVFTYSATVGMRAVAGAELTALNEGLAQYFGTTHGVLVLSARQGTPAARAGLRAGDVILQVNDRAVSTVMDLRREIQRARGDQVTLRVLRNGTNVDVKLDRD
jgi:hypothetical protein